eukprot:14584291-Heterocapsa_arctica.AAC.1
MHDKQGSLPCGHDVRPRGAGQHLRPDIDMRPTPVPMNVCTTVHDSKGMLPRGPPSSIPDCHAGHAKQEEEEEYV